MFGNRQGRTDGILIVVGLLCTGLVAGGVFYFLCCGDLGPELVSQQDGGTRIAAIADAGDQTPAPAAPSTQRPPRAMAPEDGGDVDMETDETTAPGRRPGLPISDPPRYPGVATRDDSGASYPDDGVTAVGSNMSGPGKAPGSSATGRPSVGAPGVPSRQQAMEEASRVAGRREGTTGRGSAILPPHAPPVVTGRKPTSNSGVPTAEAEAARFDGTSPGQKPYQPDNSGVERGASSNSGTGTTGYDQAGETTTNPPTASGADTTGATGEAAGTDPYATDPNNPYGEDPNQQQPDETPPEQQEPEYNASARAFLAVPAETLQVGERFIIEVYVDVGQNFIAAYDLQLAWDSTAFSVDSVGAAGMDPPMAVNLENNLGQLRFNGISVHPTYSGPVAVAALNCTVLGSPAGGRTMVQPLPGGKELIAVYTPESGNQAVTVPGPTLQPTAVLIGE